MGETGLSTRMKSAEDPMTVLPVILAPNLDIVFCGTAVSNISAQRGAYYAGPGNMFWPTLHEVGLTPRRLQPEEFREVLSISSQ